MAEFSPMMQRYLETKEQYKDCILFYRLGDFYEMFFDDAIIAARELEITLTGKDCGQEERAPMAGVPHHAAEMYISRLIAKGYKVAICEQLEDPKTAKGIVKRGVIIGDGCQIGHNVVFATLNHGLAPEERHTTYPAPIVLGKNVWIGSNATILQGVTIGDNVVIGAGAVVTRDLEANTVAAGVPAQFIKSIVL